MFVVVKLLCTGIFWGCGMARSNSLFTATLSRSHRCLAGELSYCQHQHFPLYWGLSVRLNQPSSMYVIKWWLPFNKGGSVVERGLWWIPDKQDSAAPLPNRHREGLPAALELLRRRASGKLTAAHRADNDVKKSMTTCMANDGRNASYAGWLWAKISWITEHCWLCCWEREWKTAYSISCTLFR